MAITLPILPGQVLRPSFAQGPRGLAAVKLLRLSITDRCNLRCLYCMPEEGEAFAPREQLLTAEEIIAFAAAAHSVGVTHFKITGGEPTVRDDLLQLVRGLSALGAEDLSMTTNGLLLEQLAQPLKEAGLDRLTISLDSLQPQRLQGIARSPAHRQKPDELLAKLWRGIEAACAAGFERLKINTVVLGGINDDEVVDFARLSLSRPWTIRFIEYMPLGDATIAEQGPKYLIDNAQLMQRIEQELGPLTALERSGEVGVGPAQVYRLPGAKGKLGFISAMSQPFCQSCNRLRLTATGELRSCLFDGGEVSVLPALRRRAKRGELVELMRSCVALKPETHSSRGNRAMSQLGG